MGFYGVIRGSTQILVYVRITRYNFSVDPIENPFSPGAGSPPPELVGRAPLIRQARILLGRVRERRSEKSLLLTGLRGVGKTVLLNEIERMARSEGYRTFSFEAQEDKPLGQLIAPHLRTLLFDLDRIAGVGDRAKRGLRVLRSFVSSIKITVNDFSLGLDIEPEQGAADSGDIGVDLPNVLVAVGEAAADRQAAVAIFIDEFQYFDKKELGALIMSMHRIQQLQLPIVLVGAGLPILPRLAGESKSYAERLFSFPQIGALSETDSAKALQDPAHAAGVEFESAALAEVFRLTKGYPYFVQEWGYQAWNLAESSPITVQTIHEATARVIERLDENFFRVRYDRLTQSERRFLRAMAELGESARTGDVAEALGATVASLSPVRARLISKGMIYSPDYGDLAFTVPLFGEFLVRTIAKLDEPPRG